MNHVNCIYGSVCKPGLHYTSKTEEKYEIEEKEIIKCKKKTEFSNKQRQFLFYFMKTHKMIIEEA